MLLISGVLILLRVWDKGEGFPSTQLYLNSFYYLFIHSLICNMFRSYDHLQAENIYMSELLYWQRIRYFFILINVIKKQLICCQ
jgi:hypothetical protein